MLIVNITSLQIEHKAIPDTMISESVYSFKFVDVNLVKVD